MMAIAAIGLIIHCLQVKGDVTTHLWTIKYLTFIEIFKNDHSTTYNLQSAHNKLPTYTHFPVGRI